MKNLWVTLLLALVISLASSLVGAIEDCDTGYPATCAAGGDCITGCSSALQRERQDEFCIPASDPENQICDNATQTCCKTNTGVLVGIILGCGVALIVVALLLNALLKSGGDNSTNETNNKSDKSNEATTEP